MVADAGVEEAISSATPGSVGSVVEDMEVSCGGCLRRCQSLSMRGMWFAEQRTADI
jgi:hypothetical protein